MAEAKARERIDVKHPDPEDLQRHAPHSASPRRAIALRYDPEGDPGAAPRVVAAGRGEAAESILALAAEHGVPVRRDRELLGLLAQVDLGREIPLELYAAVAEVLAFLLRVDGTARAD